MNEPIRILNMFTIMDRGGAETMVMNYYRKIDRTKIQFDFMVHRTERGVYDDEIESLGGKIYRMCPVYPQNFPKYKRMLKSFFDEHTEYKIIHSHMSELGYYAFIEAEKHGVPVRICHAHSAPKEKDLKMIVRYYFKKKMMPYTTHMFTCAEESGIWLYGKKNKNNFVQMNNAIDAEKFRYNTEVRKKIRNELNIKDELVVGHVGRFIKTKNHTFLIDIFEKILKSRPDSKLLLVGQGELETQVKDYVKTKGIENNVKFLGARNDINDIMQAMDVFLFPSLFEGLALVLVESQAAGLNCFTSDKVVTQLAKITPNLTYLPLEKQSDYWAKTIIKSQDNYKRDDTYEEIKKNNYDINDNVKWLTDFYLTCI